VFDAAPTAASILWNGNSTWVLLAGFEPDVEADLNGLGAIGSFVPDSPPDLPPHRWSRTPTGALAVESDDTGAFVAEVGVGVVHAEHPDRAPVPKPGIEALESRVKSLFDPTGRLNPGRRPGVH
jgi:glycolate oxidase FAD binding subunit